MKKRILFLSLILCSILHAQYFQMGIGLSGTNTIYSKGNGIYLEKNATTENPWGIGLEISVEYHFNPNWAIRSGIGVQQKSYRFELDNLTFPNFSQAGAYFINPKIHSNQIPILLSYNRELKNGSTLDLQFGPVFSYDVTHRIESGSKSFGEYTGPDTAIFVAYDFPKNLDNTFAMTAFVGVAYTTIKDQKRQHQIRLSYEYGLYTSVPQSMNLLISDSEYTRAYSAKVEPLLSMIRLTFTMYPDFLNFK
jgi:hypothetical protein